MIDPKAIKQGLKTKNYLIGSLRAESVFEHFCSCIPLYYYHSETDLSRKKYSLITLFLNMFFANNNNNYSVFFTQK